MSSGKGECREMLHSFLKTLFLTHFTRNRICFKNVGILSAAHYSEYVFSFGKTNSYQTVSDISLILFETVPDTN